MTNINKKKYEKNRNFQKKSANKLKKIIVPTLVVSYGISLNTPTIAFAREINSNKISIKADNNEIKNSIIINEENFPDKAFLQYVKENFDIDNDGVLNYDEILKVKSIGVKYKAIKSLKGIENFPNLTYLSADYNHIETLDLSQNYNLEVVLCNNNKLTNIILPNDIENNKLFYLDIFSNTLTEVDLYNLKALKFLHIDDNRLTHLDLSDNPLTEGHGFVAQNNYIEEITLPNNGTEYEWVEFLGTQLFPKGKEVGYKVKWYLDKEKTKELNPKETQTIICSGQTLYAEYVPIKYKIEFNPGSGTGEIKTQEFTYGVSENLLKNTYTKKEYSFAGWKDLNGKIYKDEAEILNLTDIDGKVIKLTATWTEKDYIGEIYKVNFYDGENNISSLEGTYGSKFIIPKIELNKQGLEFLGWNYGFGNNVLYKEGASILVKDPSELNGENSLNLYAVWSKKQEASTIKFKNESLDKVYDGSEIETPLVEKIGSLNDVEFKWFEMKDSKWEELKSLPINAGRYKVVATVEGDEFYEGAEAEKEFTILKANPKYEIPKNLTANYGDTLKDLDLPEGFSFEEDLSTTVGGVGLNNFKVTYTPKDTLNYEIINNIDVTINVEKAINSWVIEPSISGWMYGELPKIPTSKAKYGKAEYLYSESENGVFKELIENLDAGTWYMKAVIEEGENYTALEKIISFNIEKRNLNSDNIIIPEINEETNLKDIEIKYGEKVLEEGKDYEIVKTQEENVVTIKIIFKGNYSGEIIKSYTIEDKEPSLPEGDKPEQDEESPGEEPGEEGPVEEEKPEIKVDNISISNGINDTNEFTYGDKIIIKFNINFEDKLLLKYLKALNNEEREIALFANGIQVTESQKVINGQEVIFEYDTTKGIINPNGDVDLVIAYIDENNEHIEITKTNIKLNKKDSTSNDIKVPDINEETNLEEVILKDGERVLEKGKDYDIVKIQEENIVTIKIVFKGNYSGEIVKSYTIEDKEPSLPEGDKPEGDKPDEGEKPGQGEENSGEEEKPEIEKPGDEEKPGEEEIPEIDTPENDNSEDEIIEENSGVDNPIEQDKPKEDIIVGDNNVVDNNIDKGNDIEKLPNTGNIISNNILLIISSIITTIGGILIRRKKK